jgi:trehalose-6-phosphate synthase
MNSGRPLQAVMGRRTREDSSFPRVRCDIAEKGKTRAGNSRLSSRLGTSVVLILLPAENGDIMPRLIIVSNRLPMSLDAQDDGSYSLKQNVGGLATAIGPYHRSHHDCLWVGWSGEDPAEHTEEEIEAMRSTYEENRCVPLFLSAEQVSGFYAGFSNNTLWPLLHDFSHEAVFDPNTWETYSQVNQLFADALAPLIHKGDTVWVQDYHLMLLPNMLRQRFSDISIGWFLHVPFPRAATSSEACLARTCWASIPWTL